VPKKNLSAKRAQSRYAKSQTSMGYDYVMAPLNQSGGDRVKMAPVAQTRTVRNSKPKFLSGPDGSVTIRHRELIRNLPGSVAFAASSLSLNPGQSGTFPWLANIAQMYESYLFESFRITYVTMAASTALGSVLLSVDYDAADSAPTDMIQAFSYRSSEISSPWEFQEFRADPKDLHKQKTYFVRSGSLASNQDVKMYDTGTIYLCRDGQADTSNIGRIFVEYTVRLLTPQSGPVGLGLAKYGQFTGSSNSAPFATKAGNLPAAAPTASGTTTSVSTFVFQQPWQGDLSLIIAGTGMTGANITLSGTVTSTFLDDTYPASGLTARALYAINALQDQTLIITVTNTTITSAYARFGQGVFSL